MSANLAIQASTTTVVSTVSPMVYGQPVTLWAAVMPVVVQVVGTPTGTMTFDDGATVLGTVALNGGAAQFTTSAPAAASHSITAVYNGG